MHGRHSEMVYSLHYTQLQRKKQSKCNNKWHIEYIFGINNVETLCDHTFRNETLHGSETRGMYQKHREILTWVKKSYCHK